jgi:hypothetical protein
MGESYLVRIQVTDNHGNSVNNTQMGDLTHLVTGASSGTSWLSNTANNESGSAFFFERTFRVSNTQTPGSIVVLGFEFATNSSITSVISVESNNIPVQSRPTAASTATVTTSSVTVGTINVDIALINSSGAAVQNTDYTIQLVQEGTVIASATLTGGSLNVITPVTVGFNITDASLGGPTTVRVVQVHPEREFIDFATINLVLNPDVATTIAGITTLASVTKGGVYTFELQVEDTHGNIVAQPITATLSGQSPILTGTTITGSAPSGDGTFTLNIDSLEPFGTSKLTLSFVSGSLTGTISNIDVVAE